MRFAGSAGVPPCLGTAQGYFLRGAARRQGCVVMKLLSYFRGEAFQRGVHPPGFKHTADMPIRRLPRPGWR